MGWGRMRWDGGMWVRSARAVGGVWGGDWLDSFRNPACMGKLSQLMATGSDPSNFNISVLCKMVVMLSMCLATSLNLRNSDGICMASSTTFPRPPASRPSYVCARVWDCQNASFKVLLHFRAETSEQTGLPMDVQHLCWWLVDLFATEGLF